jgi:hypothetical protein
LAAIFSEEGEQRIHRVELRRVIIERPARRTVTGPASRRRSKWKVSVFGATRAVLSNPKNPNADDHLNDIRTAAQTVGQRIDVLHAGSAGDIDAAFASLAQRRDSALLVADDPLFSVHREQIAVLSTTI